MIFKALVILLLMVLLVILIFGYPLIKRGISFGVFLRDKTEEKADIDKKVSFKMPVHSSVPVYLL